MWTYFSLWTIYSYCFEYLFMPNSCNGAGHLSHMVLLLFPDWISPPPINSFQDGLVNTSSVPIYLPRVSMGTYIHMSIHNTSPFPEQSGNQYFTQTFANMRLKGLWAPPKGIHLFYLNECLGIYFFFGICSAQEVSSFYSPIPTSEIWKAAEAREAVSVRGSLRTPWFPLGCPGH